MLGEFGVVYKGYVKKSEVMETVAIKTLKGVIVIFFNFLVDLYLIRYFHY